MIYFLHFILNHLKFLSHNAGVAQSVEQGTENPCVDGSIPPPGIFCFYLPSILTSLTTLLQNSPHALNFLKIIFHTKPTKIKGAEKKCKSIAP